MARLIPKVEIDDINVKSERDVARCLVDQLPDDCVIYHSYPWLKTDRNDRGNTTIKEGETDFVILIPSHGMLVLEVKGGEIDYDADGRRWSRVLSGGRLKSIQDPFEQASRNTHYLENAIKLRGYQGANSLPFGFGYAVVFPDCEYSGPTPPGSEPVIIFSASDLPYLDRNMKGALTQWIRRDKPVPLSKDDMAKIQQAISPGFKLLPVLFRKVEEQEEKLFRLTSIQLQALEFLAARKRACINGVAGSGKTMLAQAQAIKFADQGLSTLLVCYNKQLVEWINDSIDESYKGRITVKHFHGLCYDWCKQAHVPFNPPSHNSDKFWKETAPENLIDAIDMVEQRFDAVIVDEGQDFYPNWWVPLEMINSKEEEGAMYVFFDPKQNLYVDQVTSLPALGDPFQLPVNCRNTKLIAEHCSEILEVPVPTREDAPVGIEPVVIALDLEFDIKKRIERYVHEWVNKGKLKAQQVAVLSPNKMSNCSLKGTSKIKGVPLIDNIRDWKDGKGILFSTVRGFKGLEADAIILFDVPEDESFNFTKSDYYVACSRAKHLLVVIKECV
ncbi:hypothetical protein A9Q99_05710 [Gammaproteobacteria bacterium 45_16_T64]|nr:hypothetical protein A9Q99_05710 [Gammaproteobacteria bacterium 45_16_T64]